MAGIVIDMTTGEVIERFGFKSNETGARKREKSIMEVVAPDGRRVISIGRASTDSRNRKQQENIAA